MQTGITTISNRHTLGDILRRTAQRLPRKMAIICGTTAWTYAEFDESCSRLAAGLAGHGVRRGDRIAILARNSHAFVAMRFAVARIGAVLVPINFMLNATEVRYILEHSGAIMLCTDSGLAETAKAASSGTAAGRIVWLPGEEPSSPVDEFLSFEELIKSPANITEHEFDASALAQIIYTSGTESRPKGVLLTHNAVLWEYVSCIADAGIAETDLFLHALPLYHCAQLDVFFGPAVYAGTTNVITGTPTADNILKLLAQYKASSFFAPPTVWISLLRSPDFAATDLSALRKGYYGASIMPVEVLKEIQRRLPQVRLWNLYGQTEIGPLATVLKPEDQFRKAGSAGRPVLNVETRIVDDHMNDVPPGTAGEVVHRSPQLMSGYFQDEEGTRKAFAGGWFHSGDLAVIDDEGYITIIDRKKDMIKTGGENVSSREVEEALYQLEGISEVAVIGTSDPKWVEAVTAIVVVKNGYRLKEHEIIEHARGRLAHFKVPKKVFFVDTLPRNPSGKLLKRNLRTEYESAFPGKNTNG
jgi:fatty-acyl-CoA synthase